VHEEAKDEVEDEEKDLELGVASGEAAKRYRAFFLPLTIIVSLVALRFRLGVLFVKIEIQNLRKRLKIGCTPEERAFPQMVAFDVALELDAPRSFETDDIVDTVDYMKVVEKIDLLCERGEWRLVEKLCYDFGREILSLSDKVREVTVRFTKFIVAESSGVTCELTVLPDGTCQ
ncbi:MAG: dihydroneopterin aldolase, partial [Bdellovibrionales bacterium]|nr:dihydroneopterin aldolase [Bdellovibrionales bacterium]